VEKGVQQARVILENPMTLNSGAGKMFLAETVLLVVEENERLVRSNRRLQKNREVEAGGARGAARALFGQVVNETLNREKVGELVEEVLNAKSLTYAYCSSCRKRVSVEVPDFKKRVDVLAQLLEEAEGKPQLEVGGVSIVVERPPLDGAHVQEPVVVPVEAELSV
jgi:hypothetical protein